MPVLIKTPSCLQPERRKREVNDVLTWFEENSDFSSCFKLIEDKAKALDIELALTREGFHVVVEYDGGLSGATYELFYNMVLTKGQHRLVTGLEVRENMIRVSNNSVELSELGVFFIDNILHAYLSLNKSPSVGEFLDAKFRIKEEINQSLQD